MHSWWIFLSKTDRKVTAFTLKVDEDDQDVVKSNAFGLH